MIAALFGLVLFLQGIPIRPNEGGSVTGTLRNAAGRPAAGVRVGAIAKPESESELAVASAMVAIGETDEAGRYRLVDIPPGRYYIAAGRVDFPTFYPGSQSLARGTLISVSAGGTVSGIDFTMQDSSVRPPTDAAFVVGGGLRFAVPIQVAVDIGGGVGGGGKLPVFSPRGFVMLRLSNSANTSYSEAPADASEILVPGSADYRVSVQNLPDGYVVKSITANGAPLATSTLTLSPTDFPQLLTSAPTVTGTMTASVTLSVTLGKTTDTAVAASGVAVTGRSKVPGRRSVFLSGTPGLFYSDGSFEFRGIQPGRHVIVTLNNPGSAKPVAASVVVGDRDLEGIELDEIATLPSQIGAVTGPRPAGTHAAGSTVPLASLGVSVVDEATRQPAVPGSVFILGPYGTSFDLPSDGRFELSRLLPGVYSFEVQAFGHAPITQTVLIGDENVTLELAVNSVSDIR